ncbi:MAG: hypothetical protein MRJ96_12265 [Nitrospirales bacterium]|nr:hypothetical protein [Nitrospira sp.]MDR4502216.1 hypothetical protein [Nitrospirales bacterium]
MGMTAVEFVQLEKLWSRIAIRPPYFAFAQLMLDPSGVLSARVPVQHRFSLEAGAISAAEIGRHLAILGLCSVALQQGTDQKHYYLAQQAHLIRRGPIQTFLTSEHFFGKAWPLAIDHRTALARTQLWDEHQETVLYDLTVRYATVGERLFERLFQGYRQQESGEPSRVFNPYTQSLPLKNVQIAGRRLTAVLGIESPQQCAGHFPFYPAIPVAILMQALAEAAGRLTQAQLGLPVFSYVVSDAEVCAKNLAFADEGIDLIAEYLHRMDHAHVLHCRANTQSGKDVGQLEVTLEHCLPFEMAQQPALTNIGVGQS